MKKLSWNKVKRWFAWLGGCALVLALAVSGFWYWINIPPQVKVPTPVMPNPNGYDYFLRAGAAYVYDSKGVDKETSLTIKATYPIADKEAWLKQNATALHLLREGLKYPALQPPVRSFDAIFPQYVQFRNLGRTLVVESHVRAERGDLNGAVQSLLDDYDFSNQIARGGPLLAGLVSVAIRSISLRELGDSVSHTNFATAKMVAVDIEKMYEERHPLYKNLQEDKWLTIAVTLQMMENPAQLLNSKSWRIGIFGGFVPAIFHCPKIFIISKSKIIDDSIKTMNTAIENARQPYIKQRPIIVAGNPLVKLMFPENTRARWNVARGDTASVAVMTMYALRAYKLDNGHYPKNLKALVPTYLHKVHIDPFDGIVPMQYELRGENYHLWSIGPDGVDNHGTPITNKNQENAPYLNWSDDSKGDVVAGKNTP